MKNEVNPFSAPWMVFWQMSWFVHNFLQNFHVVPKVYASSRSYLDCLGYLRRFSILFPNCALEAFRYCNVCLSIHKVKKDLLFLRHRGILFQRIVPIISLNLILFKKKWRIFFRPPTFVFFFKKVPEKQKINICWPNRKHFILYFKPKKSIRLKTPD